MIGREKIARPFLKSPYTEDEVEAKFSDYSHKLQNLKSTTA